MVSLGQNLRALWRMAWTADTPACVVLSVLTLLGGVLPAAELFATRPLINALASPAVLLPWLGALLLLRLLGAGMRAGGRWASDRLDGRVNLSASERLYARALQLPLVAFDDPETHDRLVRALGSGREGAGLYREALGFAAAVPPLVTYVLVAATGGWLLPPLLLLSILPGLRVQVSQFESSYHLAAQRTPEQRRLHYLEGVLTGREEAKEVRLHSARPFLLRSWQDLHHRLAAEAIALGVRNRRLGLLPGAVQAVGFAAALAILVLHARQQRFDVGTFVIAVESLRRLQGSFGDLLRRAGEVRNRYMRTARDLLGFLHAPEPEPSYPSGCDGTAPAIRAREAGFTYPGSERPALSDVRLDIAPGETVALVGENGSGKSTLVRLLLGLDRPTAGSVTWSATAPRAAVFQEFGRYYLAARDNVGFGRYERIDDDGALWRAAEKAAAAEIVAALPVGWETRLGPEHGGVDLSGGQWQRMATARGMMADGRLLVLDEPTAALDPLAEAEAFRRFAQMAKGASTVLCTHRLGSARLADRIVVLKHGRICEVGCHDDLVRMRGEYARLWAEQAQWYGRNAEGS